MSLVECLWASENPMMGWKKEMKQGREKMFTSGATLTPEIKKNKKNK